MRKLLATILTGAMVLSAVPAMAAETTSAVPTSAAVVIDGEAVDFEAYNVNDNNYFKLRDLGTVLGFDVNWDNETKTISVDSATGEVVTDDADEVVADDEATTDKVAEEDADVAADTTDVADEATAAAAALVAVESSATVLVNGEAVDMTAYTINDYTYFKLRDICGAFDYAVNWDNEEKVITVTTTEVAVADDAEVVADDEVAATDEDEVADEEEIAAEVAADEEEAAEAV